MPLIEQIVGILIINLDEWDLKLIGIFLIPPSKLFEDISKDSRDDSSIFPIIPATHGKCLSWSCLAIRKYGAIIAIEAVIDDWFRDLLEKFLLVSSVWKDAVESEWVCVFRIGKFASGDL